MTITYSNGSFSIWNGRLTNPPAAFMTFDIEDTPYWIVVYTGSISAPILFAQRCTDEESARLLSMQLKGCYTVVCEVKP